MRYTFFHIGKEGKDCSYIVYFVFGFYSNQSCLWLDLGLIKNAPLSLKFYRDGEDTMADAFEQRNGPFCFPGSPLHYDAMPMKWKMENLSPLPS